MKEYLGKAYSISEKNSADIFGFEFDDGASRYEVAIDKSDFKESLRIPLDELLDPYPRRIVFDTKYRDVLSNDKHTVCGGNNDGETDANIPSQD
jgi:hypothetical protein